MMPLSLSRRLHIINDLSAVLQRHHVPVRVSLKPVQDPLRPPIQPAHDGCTPQLPVSDLRLNSCAYAFRAYRTRTGLAGPPCDGVLGDAELFLYGGGAVGFVEGERGVFLLLGVGLGRWHNALTASRLRVDMSMAGVLGC
jgi:hypothetical protein